MVHLPSPSLPSCGGVQWCTSLHPPSPPVVECSGAPPSTLPPLQSGPVFLCRTPGNNWPNREHT